MDLDLLSLFPQVWARIMEGGERNQALKVCNNGGERRAKRVEEVSQKEEEGSLKGAVGILPVGANSRAGGTTAATAVVPLRLSQ